MELYIQTFGPTYFVSSSYVSPCQ